MDDTYMNLMNKKGQSGSGAATLVAVITLLIILYILFLPPDVRKDLLQKNGDDGVGTVSGSLIATLLHEKPGRLEQLTNLRIEHNLPSVNLFSTSGAQVLKKSSGLYIKNGVFDKKNERLNFNIADIQNTENVMLSFSVKEGRGRLIIKLNNEGIYNNEIRTRNIAPLEFPKEMLSDSNVLEFGVSEVGMMFWRTNEYTLENIQITADIIDVTGQESKNIFVVSQTEKYNLEKAKLRFYADCVATGAGTLDVFLNNHQIFSGIPECGALMSLEFSPTLLENGENKLLFRTNRGRYLIDQISLTTNLKEITFPSYYFSLSSKQFSDILSNKADVNLTMRFVDSKEFRKGKIFINGKILALNTKDAVYSRNIDNFVEEGNNGIKIEPDGTVLDILELRIDLVKH